MKKLIDNKDYEGIKQALANNPDLANEGIPYDEMNSTKAHPLHRICDGVFTGRYTDEDGVKIAKIFLDNGADVNGKLADQRDTPLIAAASLHADQLAILYIENGADIHQLGTHGATALHWAAWCGRDKLVKRLLAEGADISKRCVDFQSSPLFWATHGLKNGDKNDLQQHLACVKILLEAGADKSVPNIDGKTIFDLADDSDVQLKELLNKDQIN
jgi:ankyrin repeat protein